MIDGARERCDERLRIANRHWAALAQHDVEGIADRILLGEIDRTALQSRRDGRGDVRVIDVGGDERVQMTDERGGLLGREIETEDFDRDESIAAGLVRAKDGTERARTNLMEDPVGPECLWGKVQDGIFAVQRPMVT